MPIDAAWVKDAQRDLYSAGEYHALAAVLAPAAEAAVDAAEIGPGDDVLDVAAGDGNAAIAAAARGARVVALDLSPAQVERGRARTRELGLEVEWVVGDAEMLPFPERSFTKVVSVFGVVFAPRPEIVVGELFRVLADGGSVAVTAWAEGGFMAESTALVRELFPADDPFPDVELGWGEEVAVRERLAPYARKVTVKERVLPFDPQTRSAAGSADFAASYLAQHLRPEALASLRAAREDVAARFAGPDGVVRAAYLLAVARGRPASG